MMTKIKTEKSTCQGYFNTQNANHPRLPSPPKRFLPQKRPSFYIALTDLMHHRSRSIFVSRPLVVFRSWNSRSRPKLPKLLYRLRAMSKAGISVCASQKEKTSLGPVINSLGTRPLKKLEKPSLRAMLDRMRKPLSGFSKLRFWMRVLMTSSGAETTREAEAPAIEATKFSNQEALL